MGLLIGPVILSLGVINFNAFIDTIVGTLISIPAPAYIDKAFRLFQLPQGVFAIAIGTVLFPAFSRHAAAKRMKEFREDLSTGLRQIFFVTLPFAAFFAVLALPTVRLIYEHGKVTPGEAELVASALTFFSVGHGLRERQHPAQPGLLQHPEALAAADHGSGQPGAQRRARPAALQAAGSRRHHALHVAGQPVQLLRAHVPAQPAHRRGGRAPGGLVGRPVDHRPGPARRRSSYAVWWGLDGALGRSLWAQIVSVGLAYVAGGVAYCLAAWVMRMPETRARSSDVIRRRREPRSTDEVIDREPEA